MKKEANVSRYVKLVSSDHLGIKDARAWYKLVQRVAPPGVMISQPTVDINGNIAKTSLIRRSKGQTTELIVPLARDLLPSELTQISNSWREISPLGSYTISTNPTQSQKLNTAIQGLKIDGDDYQSLCVQLAKVQHESWMRDKSNSGWRYGPLLSIEEKTHPLMRPWSELPDKYKDVDSTNPEAFLNFISNQGYAVIRQEELGSLIKLIRSVK